MDPAVKAPKVSRVRRFILNSIYPFAGLASSASGLAE
jgi:hypothetical protein